MKKQKLETKLEFIFDDQKDFSDFDVDMKIKTKKKSGNIIIIKHKKKCSLKNIHNNQKRKPRISMCPECFRKYKEKKEKIPSHWKVNRF